MCSFWVHYSYSIPTSFSYIINYYMEGSMKHLFFYDLMIHLHHNSIALSLDRSQLHMDWVNQSNPDPRLSDQIVP